MHVVMTESEVESEKIIGEGAVLWTRNEERPCLREIRKNICEVFCSEGFFERRLCITIVKIFLTF